MYMHIWMPVTIINEERGKGKEERYIIIATIKRSNNK